MNVALLDLIDYWFHQPQNYEYKILDLISRKPHVSIIKEVLRNAIFMCLWRHDPNNWFSKTTLVALVRMAASQQFLLNQNTNC